MRPTLAALLLASAVPALASPPAVRPAPIAAIAAQVKLPYSEFTLSNGLRVVVSTDHSAPLVAVQVWYHVGSKDEPATKTGFAHLFEHLMFYGSENVPGGVFKPLESAGATDINGSTFFDRTNYFETVPTPALPFALFLESDRMGHLLGAVGQQTLDRQRGVVQNEKRQDDNEPLWPDPIYRAGGAFPRGPSLSPHHDRLDGRSRRGEAGRRPRVVPRALRTEQCGAGDGGRRRCRPGEDARRAIFRRHPARAAADPHTGGGADARRAQARGAPRPGRNGAHPARMGGAGADRSRYRPA